MATDLPTELRHHLDASTAPLELVDRATNEHFFVIRAEVFRRLTEKLDLSELTEAEKLAAMRELGKSCGWEDATSDDLI